MPKEGEEAERGVEGEEEALADIEAFLRGVESAGRTPVSSATLKRSALIQSLASCSVAAARKKFLRVG